MFLKSLILGAAFLALNCGPAKAQSQCDLELVLAMDVSRSVNPTEFELLQHGTAEAFRAKEVIETIGWLHGGLMVTVTQWSGDEQQRQVVPWRLLSTPQSVLSFADEVDAMKRAFRFDLTAPGQALLQAESLGAGNPLVCRRRVIDISGDGIKNTGFDPAPIADDIALLGVTINGLVIRGDRPDPLEFYETQIARGPLSFVEIAEGFDDFPRAILKKLLRELPPSLSELRRIPAASAPL